MIFRSGVQAGYSRDFFGRLTSESHDRLTELDDSRTAALLRRVPAFF